MGQIWIVHPDGDEPALQSQAAFDAVWQHKGFEPVPIDLAAASTLVGQPISDPAQLDIEHVRQLVADQRTAKADEQAPAKSKSSKAAPTPAVASSSTNSEG